MGDPRKLRKKYTTPKHPWQAERIQREKQLKSSFGLRNKKEIWRAENTIRKFRYLARGLVGMPVNQRKGEEERLIGKLFKLGLLGEGKILDDALSMKTEDLLARRLQTLVWKKGLAYTLTQARQLIVHGHISLDKRKVTSPGMIIEREKEALIDWYGTPLVVAKKEEPAAVPEEKKEKKPRKKKKEEPKGELPSEKIAEEIEKEVEPKEIKEIEEKLEKEVAK